MARGPRDVTKAVGRLRVGGDYQDDRDASFADGLTEDVDDVPGAGEIVHWSNANEGGRGAVPHALIGALKSEYERIALERRRSRFHDLRGLLLGRVGLLARRGAPAGGRDEVIERLALRGSDFLAGTGPGDTGRFLFDFSGEDLCGVDHGLGAGRGFVVGRRRGLGRRTHRAGPRLNDCDHGGLNRSHEVRQGRIGVQLGARHQRKVDDDRLGQLRFSVPELETEGLVEMLFSGRPEREHDVAVLGQPHVKVAFLGFREFPAGIDRAGFESALDKENLLVIRADEERQRRLVFGRGEEGLGCHVLCHADVIKEVGHDLHRRSVLVLEPVPDGVSVAAGAADGRVVVVVKLCVVEEGDFRRRVGHLGVFAYFGEGVLCGPSDGVFGVVLGGVEEVGRGPRVADLAKDEADVLTDRDVPGPEGCAERRDGLLADAYQGERGPDMVVGIVGCLCVLEPFEQRDDRVAAGAAEFDVDLGSFFAGPGEVLDELVDAVGVGEAVLLGLGREFKKLEHVCPHGWRTLLHCLDVEPDLGEVPELEGIVGVRAQLEHLLELLRRVVVLVVLERLDCGDEVLSQQGCLVCVLGVRGGRERERAHGGECDPFAAHQVEHGLPLQLGLFLGDHVFVRLARPDDPGGAAFNHNLARSGARVII